MESSRCLVSFPRVDLSPFPWSFHHDIVGHTTCNWPIFGPFTLTVCPSSIAVTPRRDRDWFLTCRARHGSSSLLSLSAPHNTVQRIRRNIVLARNRDPPSLRPFGVERIGAQAFVDVAAASSPTHIRAPGFDTSHQFADHRRAPSNIPLDLDSEAGSSCAPPRV